MKDNTIYNRPDNKVFIKTNYKKIKLLVLMNLLNIYVKIHYILMILFMWMKL